MTGNIRAPQRGDPFLSTWAQQITAGVNAICAVGPSRGLVRDGIGGIGFEPLPENRRGRVSGAGVLPYTVRYVEQDSDAGIPYTGYEIYLPDGCMTVGSSCRPMNPQAYRMSDGEKVVADGWYRLPNPESASDGDVWQIVAHAKCCAALTGVDEYQTWPKRYLWAEMHEFDRSEEDEKEDKGYLGDSLTVDVGKITWGEDDEGTLTSTITNTIKSNVFVRGDDLVQQFRLYYSFSVDEDELTLELDHLYLRDLVFAAAGTSYSAAGMKEIEQDTQAIYLKISTATSPYTGEIKVYSDVDMPEGETMSVSEQVEQEKEDTDIMILLYTLEKCRVTGNYVSSVNNIQVYQ